MRRVDHSSAHQGWGYSRSTWGMRYSGKMEMLSTLDISWPEFHNPVDLSVTVEESLGSFHTLFGSVLGMFWLFNLYYWSLRTTCSQRQILWPCPRCQSPIAGWPSVCSPAVGGRSKVPTPWELPERWWSPHAAQRSWPVSKTDAKKTSGTNFQCKVWFDAKNVKYFNCGTNQLYDHFGGNLLILNQQLVDQSEGWH